MGSGLNRRLVMVAAAVASLLCAGSGAASTVGTEVQEDAHIPHSWRKLTAAEKERFDLGHAAFNTQWSPADRPTGRTDGLGPLFNAPSCDACHNSRRRGRGPRNGGDAPVDFVIQLGRQLPDGRIERGTQAYGHVLNTGAVSGFSPEATVSIEYEEVPRWLIDNTRVFLRKPRYAISNLSGAALSSDTVIMPRMAPPVYGVGLLERVPESAIVTAASVSARNGTGGRASRLAGNRIGRFGWQATEATVASQTSSALAREMGLSSATDPRIDCGSTNKACLSASTGGDPEVEPALFDAIVLFQTAHAVPVRKSVDMRDPGARLFTSTGCAACHLPALPVALSGSAKSTIAAFTDLLLHDLGEDLADRDVAGRPVKSEWRTAPLWGMSAAVAASQPLRLMHDGRARSVREAILWHGGSATHSLHQYLVLDAKERELLESWIEGL